MGKRSTLSIILHHSWPYDGDGHRQTIKGRANESRDPIGCRDDDSSEDSWTTELTVNEVVFSSRDIRRFDRSFVLKLCALPSGLFEVAGRSRTEIVRQ